MKGVVFYILIVMTLFVCMPVMAGMFDEFGFSGTFESVYWDHDPDDWTHGTDPIYEGPYKSFENSLSLNVDWREWYAEIRLRSMNYENQLRYDPRSREHETAFELFKATAGYRGEYLKVTAGDFYKALARGIVLFVQENKELNLDRTIQGGMLDFVTSPVDVSVFGGEIKWFKFKDNLTDEKVEEYKINDKVFGGQVVGKLPMGINLGVNAAAVTLYEIIQSEYQDEDLLVGSVDLEASGLFNEKLDFYAEYAELKWDEEMPFGEDREDGKAFYTSATVYLGPVTILGEYKDYDYWNYRYSRPPTADRDDELAEIDDIKGPRLKIDYFINATNTLIYASYGRFDNQGHEGSYGVVVRNEIEHVYGGIEQTWKKLYVHVSYGNKDYVTLDEIHRRATGDFVYSITDKHSLNYYYEYKYTGNPYTSKDEHKMYLTYSMSPWFSVTAHYNKHIVELPNGSEENQKWYAGEIGVNPIPSMSINIIYGELPPGLICSGGQCRIVPEFEGVQASLTYRF
jgi:hypothetical protein